MTQNEVIMPSPLSPHRFRLTPGPRGSLAFLACLGLTSVGRVPFPTHNPLTQVGAPAGGGTLGISRDIREPQPADPSSGLPAKFHILKGGHLTFQLFLKTTDGELFGTRHREGVLHAKPYLILRSNLYHKSKLTDEETETRGAILFKPPSGRAPSSYLMEPKVPGFIISHCDQGAQSPPWKAPWRWRGREAEPGDCCSPVAAPGLPAPPGWAQAPSASPTSPSRSHSPSPAHCAASRSGTHGWLR